MNNANGFALWITGLPASGKSSITRELVRKLKDRGLPAVVLESDAMRSILTPEATYSPEERDRFYRSLARIGAIIAHGGVNVIFDATANKRAYRDFARALVPKFVEAYVACPLDVCRERDPKGIYRAAASGAASAVPGVQAPYEPPLSPEVTLDCRAGAEASADRVIDKLKRLLYI